MQVGRLFDIVYQLLLHGSVTAADLAERFEVSTRTVYRDIEALSEAGIPVYASRGRNGGISLIDRFVLDRSLLSEQEQDEILFALQSVRAARTGRDGELLSRLSSVFKRESPDWIEADFTDWGSGKEEKDRFALLKSAVLQRRVIGFTYYNAKGESRERLAEPVKLIFKNSWYLQAFCLSRQDYRTFKISRMEQVRLTEQSFEKREAPLPDLDEKGIAMGELSLLFSPRLAYRVRDEFHPSCISARPDGSFAVTTSYPAGDWIIGYLLSFGSGVTVLAPDAIREQVQKEAEGIQRNYFKEKT
ncbi:WYL domain protein [Caprobacter fermentans]|uniref:WYL domain protein n=2 Tax=Caproicibacter fermentans TaxID=2576756 RepID=A0A6N8HVW7_9FIRM|nr:WYL domain protein [Caproicibacter fermentans]